VTLAPGDSIRVRAEVTLPPISDADQKRAAVYVAHAMLDVETVSEARGQTLRECTEDLGSATSPEYTLETLFKMSK
jgi:fermentation-respiration switch protein FrsA (DUF1100 family)